MDQAEVARISRALSDPTRLRIYKAISACGEVFCGELVERHRLTPGTISHHLKILADAKLIESRRKGQFIYNRSRPETIREYARALAKMAGSKMAGKKIAGKTKAASSR
jgi:ArsR family transcriptional regulator, arsenate/arsenite/antimonite-responsive transcriptional repressor